MSTSKPFVSTKWGDWYPQHLRALKAGYAEAVESEAEQFKLGDQVVLTSFARYLIEYLELEGLKEG